MVPRRRFVPTIQNVWKLELLNPYRSGCPMGVKPSA